MTTKDSQLYGIKPKSRTTAKEISSSTQLAFASQFSSLLEKSASSDNRPSAGRARPKKEDIFTKHNKNTKKRALKDLEDVDFTQKHTTNGEEVDEATLKRTKRKLEEKSRLYNAMKRGDVEDLDERYAVDFDRKWAEKQEKNEAQSDTSSGNEGSEDEEIIEYVDEFGRTRRGTKLAAKMEEMRRRRDEADQDLRHAARPAAPEGIIYGDAVQTEAFNPDETIAQQMADLASKRDKALTPPPDEHFDGRAEIRTKGAGFFHFSANEEERQAQMAELERRRQETERAQKERKRKTEERKKEVEERRKVIQQKRGKAQADKFLNSLGGELFD